MRNKTQHDFYVSQIKRAYDGVPDINGARKRNIGYVTGIYDANGIDIFEVGPLLTLNDNLYKEKGGVFDERGK